MRTDGGDKRGRANKTPAGHRAPTAADVPNGKRKADRRNEDGSRERIRKRCGKDKAGNALEGNRIDQSGDPARVTKGGKHDDRREEGLDRTV